MKLRQLILSLFRWVLGAMGLASFGACNVLEVRCMYGQPSMDYTVSGKVTDSARKPIEGIRVVRYGDSDHLYPADTARTGADGAYVISGSGWPAESVDLCFEDTDGELGGGEFQSAEKTAVLTCVSKPKDDQWYKGVFEAQGVDVTLNKK